ncbi:hypothetical protein ACQP1G_37350 [Nocardia sp. CA-107356]|uniref:hypothetical protein n=1 Tax=Nocardia sp. CA-107356 TaxID=3239972 RepID=UPI003D912614
MAFSAGRLLQVEGLLRYGQGPTPGALRVDRAAIYQSVLGAGHYSLAGRVRPITYSETFSTGCSFTGSGTPVPANANSPTSSQAIFRGPTGIDPPRVLSDHAELRPRPGIQADPPVRIVEQFRGADHAIGYQLAQRGCTGIAVLGYVAAGALFRCRTADRAPHSERSGATGAPDLLCDFC